MRSLAWFVVGVGLAALIGCGGDSKEGASTSGAAVTPARENDSVADDEDAEGPAEAGDEARQAAAQIFATRCFTCHGAKGEGDGPGSAALNPKPRNFTDAEWQAAVSDDHLAKIIQYGGAAVGKSPAMPGNPDLMSKPQVVAALVAHIRSLSAGE